MKYLIGFDCGATKTQCAIADIEGNIIKSKTGEASSLIISGADKVCEIIFSLIDEFKSELIFNYQDIYSIVVGAAGAGRQSDANKLKKTLIDRFKTNGVILKSLFVVSDAQIALEGAFPNKPGCILIAGTGSIIYGKDGQGNFHRTGGFGRIIGDEGSGYSIGKKSLQQLSKYLDGRSKKSKLSDLIEEKYGITNADDLIVKVYNEDFDIASVVKVVIDAAEKGDKQAINILDDESNELLLHINSLLDKMNIKELPLAFAGSLLSNKNYYSTLLKEKISFSLPIVKIVTAQHTPVEGAILLAKGIQDD